LEVRETADVYAIGAVLYSLLTGRPPFQADNPLDTLLQVLERDPIPPRQFNSKVPLDLETLCLKCLEKDRRKRYATATEVADELGRMMRGEPKHRRTGRPGNRRHDCDLGGFGRIGDSVSERSGQTSWREPAAGRREDEIGGCGDQGQAGRAHRARPSAGR
jgi:serine/threonine protein kinase